MYTICDEGILQDMDHWVLMDMTKLYPPLRVVPLRVHVLGMLWQGTIGTYEYTIRFPLEEITTLVEYVEDTEHIALAEAIFEKARKAAGDFQSLLSVRATVSVWCPRCGQDHEEWLLNVAVNQEADLMHDDALMHEEGWDNE